MQRLSAETRQRLRTNLRSLITHETMTVSDEDERNYVLDLARRAKIPVFSHKLDNGKGVVITRLKTIPIHRCPKCGYQAGAVVQ